MAYGIKKSTNNLEEYHERTEGYVAVYVTIDLADGDTVYEPITDVPFDSEVSDKDFICQQAVNHVRNARRACSSPDAHNRIITDYPWTVTVDIPAIDFTWYAEVA